MHCNFHHHFMCLTIRDWKGFMRKSLQFMKLICMMVLDCIHILATINVQSILEREKWRKEWLKEELDKKRDKDKDEDKDKDKGEDHLESATDQKPGGLQICLFDGVMIH